MLQRSNVIEILGQDHSYISMVESTVLYEWNMMTTFERQKLIEQDISCISSFVFL